MSCRAVSRLMRFESASRPKVYALQERGRVQVSRMLLQGYQDNTTEASSEP